jgi:hypothetical protein
MTSTRARRTRNRCSSLAALDDRDQSRLTDLQITREENYPELNVVVDRQKAGPWGSEQQVAQTVLTSPVGIPSSRRFRSPTRRRGMSIHQRAPRRAYRPHVDDMTDLFMKTPSAGWCRLTPSRASRRGSGPVIISRKYLQRSTSPRTSRRADLGGASQAVSACWTSCRPRGVLWRRWAVDRGAGAKLPADLSSRPCWRILPSGYGAGVAVQVADRSAGIMFSASG